MYEPKTKKTKKSQKQMNRNITKKMIFSRNYRQEHIITRIRNRTLKLVDFGLHLGNGIMCENLMLKYTETKTNQNYS